MRWIFGILMLGLIGVQSAIIVWQRAILATANERHVEREASTLSQQQRIAELDQALAAATAGRRAVDHDGQKRLAGIVNERDGLSTRLQRVEQQLESSRVEHKRSADALVVAEKELGEQREALGKREQELTLVRAELLWLKVRGAADGGEPVPTRAPKQPQKQSQPQVLPVVTAHSAVASETATANAGAPAGDASVATANQQTDGVVHRGSGVGADGVAASTAPPKKVVRREARRIRKDAPVEEPAFSFLP